MSERVVLSPCPFCNGRADIVPAEECGDGAYVVQCSNAMCSASSKVVFALRDDPTRILVEAWNARAVASRGLSGAHRVTAGPYTLAIPANGRATLYEADGAGVDRELPWGVGHFEALVQFAGEVIRLQAMVNAMAETEALRQSVRQTINRSAT